MGSYFVTLCAVFFPFARCTQGPITPVKQPCCRCPLCKNYYSFRALHLRSQLLWRFLHHRCNLARECNNQLLAPTSALFFYFVLKKSSSCHLHLSINRNSPSHSTQYFIHITFCSLEPSNPLHLHIHPIHECILTYTSWFALPIRRSSF